jgi:hypothetical protein
MIDALARAGPGQPRPYSALGRGASPATRLWLLFFAEEFDVFGAFLERAGGAALH